MLAEIMAEDASAEIRIVGINRSGSESGNAGMMAGRTLSLLQDNEDDQVWPQWQAAWRDVIVLDRRNARIAVFNLTQHGLHDADNYAALKAMLLEAAGER